MRRFFIESDTVCEDIVELPESESHHISRVLRLKAGDAVELLDGRGKVYSAVLIETGRRVRARITQLRDEANADSVRLIIGQGQLKGQKMDTVIQKCTELGVTRIAPFWSSRCQGRLNDLQGAKKLERYQRIVEAACKQCHRPDLMEVEPPCDFQELLSAFPAGEGRLRLVFWEEERAATLHTIAIAEAIREVVIVLGPEGGLAADEVARARSEGWRTVSLGSRILRAETATLTAAAIVQFLLHNI